MGDTNRQREAQRDMMMLMMRMVVITLSEFHDTDKTSGARNYDYEFNTMKIKGK